MTSDSLHDRPLGTEGTTRTGATQDARTEELRRGLETVRQNIADVARRAGRDPESIELLPVTKFHPAEDLVRLADLGVTTVGENREQEARDKHQFLQDKGIDLQLDMIGQIQSKKCSSIARWANRVHAVDRMKLVTKLNNGVEQALADGERRGASSLSVFIQWSADGDPDRGGAPTSEVQRLVEAVVAAEHLTFAGIMVVPPLDAEPLAVFSDAAALTDRLAQDYDTSVQLSAGMSADLEAAIQAGSTIVRVGTAIMGQRPLP